MKNIVILGSSGSIGTQTLSVIEACPEEYRVTALAVNTSAAVLREQIRKFRPKAAVIYDPASYEEASRDWPYPDTKLLCGMDGLLEIVRMPEAQIVVTAMVGMIGLRPTVAAIEAGKDIALANKETLVCAGQLIMRLAAEHHVRILPVDSEHGAIFQCLYGVRDRRELTGLILTASGGPFRGYTKEQLQSVTKEQALRHPSWKMGAKITIDSATMVNKGLETIEARWLFDCGPERIRVVVHPQSVIHSMIELVDGSVIAQLAVPDMRLPIEVALAYPERGPRVIQPLDLASYGSLTFEEPDEEVFAALRLAREVMQAGGLYPAVLNAANECAVADFLADRIGFTGIYERIEKSLEWASAQGMRDTGYELAEVFEWEKRIRDLWSRNG